jgi:hypothetical protein
MERLSGRYETKLRATATVLAEMFKRKRAAAQQISNATGIGNGTVRRVNHYFRDYRPSCTGRISPGGPFRQAAEPCGAWNLGHL